MRKLIGGVLISLSALCVTAQAETLDMSTIKCSDTFDRSADEAALVMFWFHGYYGGKAGDTTVDFGSLGDVAKELGDLCRLNPNVGLMTALKNIVGHP